MSDNMAKALLKNAGGNSYTASDSIRYTNSDQNGYQHGKIKGFLNIILPCPHAQPTTPEELDDMIRRVDKVVEHAVKTLNRAGITAHATPMLGGSNQTEPSSIGILGQLGSTFGLQRYEGRPSLRIEVTADSSQAAQDKINEIYAALEVETPLQVHGHNPSIEMRHKLDSKLEGTGVKLNTDPCAIVSLPPRPEQSQTRTI